MIYSLLIGLVRKMSNPDELKCLGSRTKISCEVKFLAKAAKLIFRDPTFNYNNLIYIPLQNSFKNIR